MDQLFALIKAYLRGKLSWEVPEEVAAYLHEQLSPVVQAKGEVMHSATMKGIRSFSSWLKPLGVVSSLELVDELTCGCFIIQSESRMTHHDSFNCHLGVLWWLHASGWNSSPALLHLPER